MCFVLGIAVVELGFAFSRTHDDYTKDLTLCTVNYDFVQVGIHATSAMSIIYGGYQCFIRLLLLFLFVIHIS